MNGGLNCGDADLSVVESGCGGARLGFQRWCSVTSGMLTSMYKTFGWYGVGWGWDVNVSATLHVGATLYLRLFESSLLCKMPLCSLETLSGFCYVVLAAVREFFAMQDACRRRVVGLSTRMAMALHQHV